MSHFAATLNTTHENLSPESQSESRETSNEASTLQSTDSSYQDSEIVKAATIKAEHKHNEESDEDDDDDDDDDHYDTDDELNPEPRLYFAFGSNLWLEQMQKRCPKSVCLGAGVLRNYRWLINERGYANVQPTAVDGNEVWGLVYLLKKKDEAALDKNEGVPWAYQKEWLPVTFWRVPYCRGRPMWVDVNDDVLKETRPVLVYVDHIRVQDSKPWDEYVYRMNMGIRDALSVGVPESYVCNVLRKFIKPEDYSDGRQDAMRKAERQAARFEDENDL